MTNKLVIFLTLIFSALLIPGKTLGQEKYIYTKTLVASDDGVYYDQNTITTIQVIDQQKGIFEINFFLQEDGSEATFRVKYLDYYEQVHIYQIVAINGTYGDFPNWILGTKKGLILAASGYGFSFSIRTDSGIKHYKSE